MFFFSTASAICKDFWKPLCGFWIPPKYGEHEAAWRPKGVPQISKTISGHFVFLHAFCYAVCILNH